MAIAPCAIYGTHRMRAPKNVGVRDMNGNPSNASFKLGSLYTCGCGDRIITQGTPHTGDYIRDYVTEGGIRAGTEIKGPTGSVSYRIPTQYVYYKGGNVLEGYSFTL